jgi:ankyrin repeat protein
VSATPGNAEVWTIGTDDPLAVAAVEAIHAGDVDQLRRLLDEHAGLARARLGSESPDGMTRTLLHVATDWPGHFPNVAASIAALIEAGADVNARFTGPHTETPLHWAASSDDVDALEALLDRGADIEAPGAVIAGGTPLSDAVAFGQWNAARRLVERGAHTPLREAAALGLLDRVQKYCAFDPTPAELDQAMWYSCHGGQRHVAAYLLDRGAQLNWVTSWDDTSPLDAAERSGAAELARWLRTKGAKHASELTS